MLRAPKGSASKPLLLQLVRNFREDGLLRRSEFDHNRHQHALAFDLLPGALARHSFEQHAFVGAVLVDDPQAFVVHRQNERLAQLAQRFQGGEKGSDIACRLEFPG